MASVSGFTGWADQIWNGNRTYGDGRQVNSDGILLNRMTPRMGTRPILASGKLDQLSILEAVLEISWALIAGQAVGLHKRRRNLQVAKLQ
jgi:hypothetical protein